MTQSEKSIIIYSTTWCGYCKMLKKYLDDKGVKWTEKDIEQDAAAHAELMEKIGGDFPGVPVTDVGGTIVLGFDRPSLDAAIAS